MALSTTPTNAIHLAKVGTIQLLGAEISAYDAGSQRVFVTANSESSPGRPVLQIVDVANPAAPVQLATIDPASFGLADFTVGDVSSVTVSHGVVAVALVAATKTDPGRVAFLDIDGTLQGSVTVGALPDHVVFTPDGMKVLVANEGEADAVTLVDPAGSVSIIDISAGVAAASVATADFSAFEAQADALKAAGLRLFDGKSLAQDVEPEYIAVTADGKTAAITLQEANALAFLDLASNTITHVAPLGLKDWNSGANVLDASDKDGIDIGHAPVFGQYMPDNIASYLANGQNYFVTANEGDDRGEAVRVKTLNLDPTAFADAATLKTDAVLGRLNVASGVGINGDTDGDGDIDMLLTYGARSFSITDSQGKIVFDSAGLMEQVLAEQTPSLFNADSGDAALVDSRSDNKGPEPEGVTVGSVGGKTYAFVGMERAGGGVMVFDITNPANVSFVQYAATAGDIGPEGLAWIGAESSPTGQTLLAVSNEISNTLTLYSVSESYNPDGSLTGTAGDDSLDAGFGDDAINGLAGNDSIAGGEGGDTINGGLGIDTVSYASSGTAITADLLAGTATREVATMLDGEAGWQTRPLFTIGDSLSGTTGALNATTAGTYTPVAIPDGIGAYELDGDTVRMFVNHELSDTLASSYQVSDGGAGLISLKGARVSYFDIDKTSLSIVDGGIAYDKIYDASGNIVTSVAQLATPSGLSRLCSSSLYEADEFGAGMGIVDRIYMTSEESGSAGGHPAGGLNWALDTATGALWAVPAMGHGSWENVVQVDTGTTTHVGFLLGDDTTGAPMYLYVGAKNAAGDFLDRNGLKNGQLYAWKADATGVNSPAELAAGSQAGTWVAINAFDATLAGQTGYDSLGYKKDATLQGEADSLGAFTFSRPEDLSRNPDNGTEVVFASTGASIGAAVTADSVADVTDTAGTLYKMTLDFSNLAAPTGTLSVLYNGNTDATRAIRNPDNLDWADDGFVYVQEDRSLQSLFTDPAAANPNEASVLRIDPTSGDITRVAEIDRSAVPMGQTDSVAAAANSKGNWESSGILDVSSLFGKAPATLFLSTVQGHSLTGGSITSQSLVEGGQILLLGRDGGLAPVLESDSLISVENLVGSQSADRMLGDNRGNALSGLGGNDLVHGRGGNDILDGGAGNDSIIGGIGDDALIGGGGKDILTGGAGADSFCFGTALSPASNIDRITDFSGADQILLDGAIFAALTNGPLSSADFHQVGGASPRDVSDHIIYNPTLGGLYYDADGLGGAPMVRFATVAAGTMLMPEDLVVVTSVA